ncbi:phosphate ABC transporter substrate-binding protein PstS [Caulobacter sp. NIBR2454]|uniref:phosphate ABC transporter substrate-binding protein PstS n=1 Tax=Caulobacter sp. NIBR2454 TaxID=3015996 RepID=UPI0022B6C2A9|nr:phosphate ABC transporter substrate-binding protein PstS [Caulobacter sp. NIBR2454]
MRAKSILLTLAMFAGAATLAACGQSDDAAKTPAQAAAGSGLSGAGATFPAPLYAKWAEDHRAETGVAINYQAIGSGGGIKQIKAKTVDFGATDKPLSQADLDEAGLFQFPTVIGGVVPIVNLPGVAAGQLKLTGAILGDIYTGAITKWSDPKIAAINAGVNIPNLPITVVHRADGSGTTFLFTTYLTAKSPAWKDKVGAGDAVSWPTGQGGKGNDGVSAFVRQTPGSIGYVEYAFAKQNGLAHAQLQSKDGSTFLNPSAESFAAAAAGADWASAPGNALLLIDQDGAGAWPITGATFILVHKQPVDAAKKAQVLKFFEWTYAKGDAAASALDYVPLPAAVKTMMLDQMKAQTPAA